MVWPPRTGPAGTPVTNVTPVQSFYNGESCQYCLGQGDGFGGHPYSEPGYLGDVVCPVCLGQGHEVSDNDLPAVNGAQYADGQTEVIGAPAQGGGGRPASTILRPKNPSAELGQSEAT